MGKNECQNSIDHGRVETKVNDAEMAVKKIQQCRRCPVNGYKDDNDWSEHLSSSGKIYYYNKRTEESQWEVPKGWHDRHGESKEPDKDRSTSRGNHNVSKESNNRDDHQDSRDSRDTKDYRYNKDKNSSKDHRLHDDSSRRDRDSRKTREKDGRDRDRDRDRDYRDRESRDYESKQRVSSSGSSKRDSKYNSPSIRTVGQSTPSSSTSHNNRSYHRRPSPDSLNGSGSGSVQDISPPGTPTNDDTVIAMTTGMSPAPLYTTHISSPLITTSIATSRVLPLPSTPHTPLLSPIVHNSSTHLSTSYLHPLQQALLLQQQQATTTTTNKETFGSPKLPTVKNHITEAATSTPTSSPRISSSSSSSSNAKPVPMVQSPDISSNRSDSATPPPPPPPPKENNRIPQETKPDRTPKLERQHSQTSTTAAAITTPTTLDSRTELNDHLNRSKNSHDVTRKADDTPLKASVATPRTYSTERLIRRTIKLERPDPISFLELPDLNKYSEYFSPSVAEFHTAFYCNTLENQISSTWDETMNLLHTEGYRSAFNLSLSKQNVGCEDAKLEISSGWVDALNAVIQKVESLQDSSISSESRANNRDANKTKKNRTESMSNNNNNNDDDSLNCSTTSTYIDHNDANNTTILATTLNDTTTTLNDTDIDFTNTTLNDEGTCSSEHNNLPPPPPSLNNHLPSHDEHTDDSMEDSMEDSVSSTSLTR